MNICIACALPARIWTPDGPMCGDDCADAKLELARVLNCSTATAAYLMKDALLAEDPTQYVKEMLCLTEEQAARR